MSRPLFRLDDVSKTYGERQVVALEQLDVMPGEILAIVGPSGAGKSTLLRIMGILEPPTTGTLTFDGAPINLNHPPLGLRRQVTMVFQRPLLLNASVLENVIYGLHVRGSAPDGQVDALLAVLGLTDLKEARARTLSGGEMQRVALARALAIRPRILLLDEPTANLDPYNVKLIEEMIRTTNRQQRTTVVVVTHNVFQARRLADRIAFLLDGHLVEIAPAETFFVSPSDPQTQAFVNGDMVY